MIISVVFLTANKISHKILISKHREVQILNKINKFLVVGGDKRQLYMADFLEENGFDISLYGIHENKRKNFDNLKTAVLNSDVIVLPLPVSKDGKTINAEAPIKENIDELLSYVNEDKIVFGGIIGKGIENKLKKKNIRYFDYFAREELTLKNTVPTVQGILKVIMENIDYTIHSSEIAVFGYGRVGKITAEVLALLGAKVTVCARKNSDLVSAEIKHLNTCKINDFQNTANKFDIIINTVPYIVINRNIIGKVKKNCLIIDVSSAPYGVDFASALEYKINALQCPSLPGKVAPKSAGIIIGETIIDILKEENLWES